MTVSGKHQSSSSTGLWFIGAKKWEKFSNRLYVLWRDLKRICWPYPSYESPVPLPWFHCVWARDRTSQLHRIAFSRTWEDAGGSLKRFTMVVQGVFWPFTSCLQALRELRQHGRVVREQYGITRLGQLIRLLWFANRFNIAPHFCYLFKLFCPDESKKPFCYITSHEHARILEWVNSKEVDSLLSDKFKFAIEFARNDLPVADVLFVVNAIGACSITQGCRDARFESKYNLIVKPLYGLQGTGICFLDYSDEDDVWLYDGDRIQEENLAQWLVAFASRIGQPVIVQRCLDNHRSMQGFSVRGLCTFRLITVMFPDGHGEILSAGLRMPMGGNRTDNITGGGMGARVDVQTGVLSSAFTHSIADGQWKVHPETGARIEGHVIEHWEEIRDVALRAHEACSQFGQCAVVGWDIALTENGVVLIEGNRLPSPHSGQVFLGRGYGGSTFEDVIFAWLEDGHEE